MRLAENVAHIRNAYEILVGKYKGRG